MLTTTRVTTTMASAKSNDNQLRWWLMAAGLACADGGSGAGRGRVPVGTGRSGGEGHLGRGSVTEFSPACDAGPPPHDGQFSRHSSTHGSTLPVRSMTNSRLGGSDGAAR